MKGSKRVQVLVAVFLPPILLTAALILRFSFTAPAMPELPAGPYPGDNVISDAVMVYDQTRHVNALPSDVWPWILQVGKGRGGMKHLRVIKFAFADTYSLSRLVYASDVRKILAKELASHSDHQPNMAAAEAR